MRFAKVMAKEDANFALQRKKTRKTTRNSILIIESCSTEALQRPVTESGVRLLRTLQGCESDSCNKRPRCKFFVGHPLECETVLMWNGFTKSFDPKPFHTKKDGFDLKFAPERWALLSVNFGTEIMSNDVVLAVWLTPCGWLCESMTMRISHVQSIWKRHRKRTAQRKLFWKKQQSENFYMKLVGSKCTLFIRRD